MVSCGASKNLTPQETLNPLDAIMEMKQIYLENIRRVQDDYGFIHSDGCDSLLFSGLISVAGADVDIYAARDNQTTEWFRTPYKDCYRNERENINSSRRSKSTTSRDMYAGAMWSLYSKGDLVGLNDIRSWGRKNNWIMGKGPLDRVYFTPNFISTLYDLLERDYAGPPVFWIDPLKDHQRHVVALNILLKGAKRGSIPKKAYDLLKDFAKSDPNNALFSYGVNLYGSGDQSHAISILLDKRLFPMDLPAKRCRRWLWEKHSDSWVECSEDDKELASGGDFLFLAHLLENSQK